ncbi:transposase [Amycolatopsis sulphurea]|uniref:Transposase n=1 Tax=Amycolatopsis sulphurea TaxID=76022 RepID=A0A2A9FH24_9PSEU|nr:ISL3 family transposase [Amycolatopsis sulphurea]PFG49810.1 transposase [Amycolatopsis sulphurea]
MLNDTDATVLFDLDGVAVARVYRDSDGIRVVQVVTADQAARVCPGCGTRATRVKGLVTTRPRDLEHGGGPVRLQWRKRRWVCGATSCHRGSFTEQIPQLAAGMRTTGRLRRAAGVAVVDGGRTLTQAGRDLGLSWPTVHREFTAYARQVLPGTPAPTDVLGVDEVRRGKPVWEQDEQTGKWRLATDRWHVGFVDVTGRQGLFGQVEGRATTVVVDWITAHDSDWQASIRYVAIDMCAVFRAAVRRALPHAQVVVGFHVVQLANRRLAELRRRCTWAQRRRRGRRGDPEWAVRGLLRRNAEDLTAEQRDTLTRTLTEIGTYGRWILTGWHAKEKLRTLLRLTAKHAHTGPDRHAISNARYQFMTHCLDSRQPELISLAQTIDDWWDGIEAYILTGITNAASEGNNRLIKLEARNAFGFRNPANQRLRSRCATTRQARRDRLPDQL